MNTKQFNHYLDLLQKALRAKEDAAKALKGLIASCGGKRTLPLMEGLLACMQALYPNTDAILSVRSGEWNVSFPRKGSGYQTWNEEIRPHLPLLRPATGGKKKAASPIEKAEKALAALRPEGLTKQQAYAAVELAFSKKAK